MSLPGDVAQAQPEAPAQTEQAREVETAGHFDAPGLTEGRAADGSLAILHHYPSGVAQLQLAVPHENLTPGAPWGWRISREGELIAEAMDLAWEGEASGMLLLPLELTWEDGVYDLDLFLNGQLASSGSVTIGTPPAPAEAVQTDEFDDPSSGWGTGDLGFGRIAYDQGRLVMTVTEAGTPIWSVTDQPFADAVFEVEATTMGGPADNAYGVVVRYQDENNFYAFLASADGYYAALHFENNQLVWDHEWTFDETSLLRLGNDTNKLRVLSDGPMLRFYINDQLRIVIPQALWSEGQSGLLAATTNEPGVVIGFDKWRAWALQGTGGTRAPYQGVKLYLTGR